MVPEICEATFFTTEQSPALPTPTPAEFLFQTNLARFFPDPAKHLETQK